MSSYYKNTHGFGELGWWGYSGGNRNTGDDDSVVRVNAEAPRVATVAELEARIKAAGGKLIVSPYASELIVAVNSGKFNFKKRADGNYEISEGGGNSTGWIIAALAGLLIYKFMFD